MHGHDQILVQLLPTASTCVEAGQLVGYHQCIEVCRLVVTNFATRIRACAEFQFKIPTKSERMRGFSSQICDNQPANLCS